jgi:hypothetical protein
MSWCSMKTSEIAPLVLRLLVLRPLSRRIPTDRIIIWPNFEYNITSGILYNP